MIAGFWTFQPEDIARRDPIVATGADRIATTLQIAIADVLEALTAGSLEKREPRAPTEVPAALPVAAE
jgi:hypothetical protein